MTFIAALVFASAASAGTATFAIVIGTNRSVDADLEPLRYADDDAARYFDLFRSLGTRTYLLSRLDEDTVRLHPQAAAEAELPRAGELDALVGLLKSNVALAKERGLETVFYFVYAGHGNVDGNKGYITLEDSRLFGQDVMRRVVERVGADQSHLIVDACYSYFLAYGRGAGGTRRPVEGFASLSHLGEARDIGLILSTSSAAESHEWEAFQAGVFSHEIRSGLYGAADADGDGRVSYREIAAFVENANAAIPNERYRPRLHARPPSGSGTLVDLREQKGRMLEIDGQRHGRYLLENQDGVRLVDFHSAPGLEVKLVRPGSGVLYLRQPDKGVEYEVPPSDRPVKLAMLTATEPRVQGRGAAHTAFSKLFQRPFDVGTVTSFQFEEAGEATASAAFPWGSVVGGGVLAAGALMTVGAVAAGGVAAATFLTTPSNVSQAEAVQRNQVILVSDITAVALLGGGLAAAGAGVALFFLWPDGED